MEGINKTTESALLVRLPRHDSGEDNNNHNTLLPPLPPPPLLLLRTRLREIMSLLATCMCCSTLM
jgi:hypothetical protein